MVSAGDNGLYEFFQIIPLFSSHHLVGWHLEWLEDDILDWQLGCHSHCQSANIQVAQGYKASLCLCPVVFSAADSLPWFQLKRFWQLAPEAGGELWWWWESRGAFVCDGFSASVVVHETGHNLEYWGGSGSFAFKNRRPVFKHCPGNTSNYFRLKYPSRSFLKPLRYLQKYYPKEDQKEIQSKAATWGSEDEQTLCFPSMQKHSHQMTSKINSVSAQRCSTTPWWTVQIPSHSLPLCTSMTKTGASDLNVSVWEPSFGLQNPDFQREKHISSSQIHQSSFVSPCPLWCSRPRTVPSGTQEQKHRRQLPWIFISPCLSVFFC